MIWPNIFSITHSPSARNINRDLQREMASVLLWPSVKWQKVDFKMRKTDEWLEWQRCILLMLCISCKASMAWHICLLLSLRFPTLEHCTSGGESLLPEEFEQWKQRTGLRIHEVYGQSETVGEQAPSAPFQWAQLQTQRANVAQCVLMSSLCTGPLKANGGGAWGSKISYAIFSERKYTAHQHVKRLISWKLLGKT